MKKITNIVLSILLIAGLLAPCIAIANAETTTQISGSWTGRDQVPTVEKIVGANVFIHLENNGDYGTFINGKLDKTVGPITGSFHQSMTQIYHYSSPEIAADALSHPEANPTFNWVQFERTFESAKVLGQTGGLTMKLVATGQGNTVGTNNWELTGTWLITGGTGDLAGIHGQGTWWHTRNVPGLQYEGQITL